MSNLSKAAKALILTWILIGLLIAGGIGFYLGRTTAPRIQQNQQSGTQNQEGFRDNRQGVNDQQPLEGGFQQQPGVNREGPTPTGAGQGGQPVPQK